MTFTYDLSEDDENLLNISRVRLELGDTQQDAGVRPSGANLTDEEILFWLEEEDNDIMRVVARAAQALALAWTTVTNITVGPRREELGQVAEGWAKRAGLAGSAAGIVYGARIISLDNKHNPYRVRPEDEMSR